MPRQITEKHKLCSRYDDNLFITGFENSAVDAIIATQMLTQLSGYK